MIPTSIDGTDITGVTIDGTDVTEITVDGDTVFSAGPSNLPVAFSNLIAWYPFDSAEYGGSNADDVTAIIGGSGDDTAFDGSLNSNPTYQLTGGVTDINAGTTSGAFDFDGIDDSITIDNSLGTTLPVTLMYWLFPFSYNDSTVGMEHSNFDYMLSIRHEANGIQFFSRGDGGQDSISASLAPTNQWTHVTGVDDGSGIELYVNGNSVATGSSGGSKNPGNCRIAETDSGGTSDAKIDDVRWYDKALSASEISQIYQNTEP
jgi:hypothetical protein